MDVVCEEPVTRDVFRKARHLGRTGLSVLVEGETGTGKEVVAQEIHRSSRAGKFVVADCSILGGETARSELFGAARGAYTGAHCDRQGLVEFADGGTLFIDELGDADADLQKMLLRFLQFGEYRRVGDPRPRTARVRVVAATNKDLRSEVDAGRFRKDLLHRISVGRLRLPPLRERPKDVIALFKYYASRQARSGGVGLTLSPELRLRLLAHDWPGNARELENVVALMAAGGDWDPEDAARRDEPAEDWLALPFREARRLADEVAMRHYLRTQLRECGGNVSRAARIAGIGRQYYQSWLSRVGVEASEFRNGDSGGMEPEREGRLRALALT